MIGFPGSMTTLAPLLGTAFTSTQQEFITRVANIKVVDLSLDSGVNSGALGAAEVATGHDLFEDVEAVEVDFLIAPGMSSRSDQTTVTNDLIANASTIEFKTEYLEDYFGRVLSYLIIDGEDASSKIIENQLGVVYDHNQKYDWCQDLNGNETINYTE